MTLTTSGCSIGADALTAIKAGLEAANVDADVVVAGNFVATVRQLTDSSIYHVDRGAGVVGAKTVNAPGGPTIVFNYDIASQMPAPELERPRNQRPYGTDRQRTADRDRTQRRTRQGPVRWWDLGSSERLR